MQFTKSPHLVLEATTYGKCDFCTCWVSFYRAMHYMHSAKCGLAIALHPLSVTLVDCDHTGCKCWKLIVRTISTTPSLFVAQRPSTGGTWGNFVETRLLMTPPTIHEKISLGIIIVWSSTFQARKIIPKLIFFKPVYLHRMHRAVIFAIAQLSCQDLLTIAVKLFLHYWPVTVCHCSLFEWLCAATVGFSSKSSLRHRHTLSVSFPVFPSVMRHWRFNCNFVGYGPCIFVIVYFL